MLCKLKEEADRDAINVRTLCPTRWTVRAESLGSILANYDSIQELWETALHKITDTETKARIRGMQSQMKCFKFLFCLVLTEMILWHTDKLSETLQAPKLSGVKDNEIAMLTVKTLKSLWTDENFNLFWQKIEKKMNELDVDEPQLARRQKTPRWFEQGVNLLQLQKMNIIECTSKHLILHQLAFVVGLTRKVLKFLATWSSYYSRHAVQGNLSMKS